MSDTLTRLSEKSGTLLNIKRYFQFSLLLLAAGAIYPLLYLRQNFESSIYEGITVYNLYFGYIAVMGALGTLAALKLKSMTAKKKVKS